MTTLISFLGKSQRDATNRYQRATYRFEDGQDVTTPFFGSALMLHLHPARTLLLGTAGSMWDALDIDVDAPEWVELEDAVENASVDQSLLDRVTPRTRAAMSGAELVLMPYARTESEQMSLLADLACRVNEGEEVVIDITHGFRHLPLLALVAARYLTHVRKAVVGGIYYGALEMKSPDGITPVLKLDGLLRMLDWIEAFAAHDASGNYGVFAPLLRHDKLKAKSAELLELAAHQERVTNASGAGAILTPLLGEIGQLGGATGLFGEQLQLRLDWARKPDRESREFALYEAYLARKDFLRATIYLQESTISATCAKFGLKQQFHTEREKARESLKENSTDFCSLSDIRNMLAHGTAGGDDPRAKSASDATATAANLERRLLQLSKQLRRDSW